MKLFPLPLLVILALAIAASAQVLSEGSVVALQVLTNPDNSQVVYDFELCCGIQDGEGKFLAPGFGYDGSYFALSDHGYQFAGTLYDFDDPVRIDDVCYSQTATITDGILELPDAKKVNGLVADYSQVFCEQDGVYWSAGGGLSVHSPVD